jgi:predicted small secreted protein
MGPRELRGWMIAFNAMKTKQMTCSQSLLFSLIAAAIVAMASTGCNTAAGFGKDIEKAGNSIQNWSK